MVKKRNNILILQRLLFVLLIFAVVGFVLNWFLAYRLENYLKKELTDKVSSATNGFYQLSFDHLEIDLFTGELAVNGITFKPDSLVFSRYVQQDSLPEIYFDISLGALELKGINLIWTFSYKELYFRILELEKPDIAITHTGKFISKEKADGDPIGKVLHQLISPYIDILAIDKIEVEHASVSYTLEDDETPVSYALKDVELDGFDFRLDKNSYTSGKMLYCNDFEFTTNQPQILLSNNQMFLRTDSIHLSTKDSVLYVKNIYIIPRSEVWLAEKEFPSGMLNASIGEIDVEGIAFVRKDLRNRLHARSLDINRSDIQYTKFNIDSLPKKEPAVDTIRYSRPWTLYEVISPIFQSVTIDTIAIVHAGMEYTSISEKYKDAYSLEDFNFFAYEFMLDSLSDMQKNILYSGHFALDATGIKANMEEKTIRFP